MCFLPTVVWKSGNKVCVFGVEGCVFLATLAWKIGNQVRVSRIEGCVFFGNSCVEVLE